MKLLYFNRVTDNEGSRLVLHLQPENLGEADLLRGVVEAAGGEDEPTVQIAAHAFVPAPQPRIQAVS